MAEASQDHLARHLHLFLLSIGAHRGYRINDYKTVYSSLAQIRAKEGLTSRATQSKFIQILATLLKFSSIEKILLHGKTLIGLVLSESPLEVVFEFCQILRKLRWRHFSNLILPTLMTRMERVDVDMKTLMIFSDIMVGDRDTEVAMSKNISSDVLLRLRPVTPLDLQGEKTYLLELPILVKLAGLIGLEAFFPLKQTLESIFALLKSGVDAQFEHLELSGDVGYALESVIGLTLESLSKLTTEESESVDSLLKLLSDCIALQKGNPVMLRGLSTFVQRLRVLYPESLTVEDLEKAFPSFAENFSSANRLVRLYTAQILSVYQQPQIPSIGTLVDTESCYLMDSIVECDSMTNSLETVRDKLVVLRKIEQLYTLGRSPVLYNKVGVQFFFSQLTVNFAPLWKEVMPTIQRLATEWREGKTIFWDTWWGQYESLKTTSSRDIYCASKESANHKTLQPKKYVKLKFDDYNVNGVLDIIQKISFAHNDLDAHMKSLFFLVRLKVSLLTKWTHLITGGNLGVLRRRSDSV